MRLLNRLNAVAALIVLVFAASILSAQSGKLPDGQPNMQGMYTRAGVKGLEAEPPFNPIDPGEKNPLSVSNREDGLGPYPRIFGQGGNVLRGAQQRAQRRTGIVFPENKKLRHILFGKQPHVYGIIYAVDKRHHVVHVLHIRHGARGALSANEKAPGSFLYPPRHGNITPHFHPRTRLSQTI